MPDINDIVETVALEPTEFTVDGQTAKNPLLPELIQGVRHVAAAAATSAPNSRGGRRSGWRTAMTGRAVPGGTV